MAHIACITNGLTGLLLASFEAVRRLRVDGHRITYLAPPFVRDAVWREGLAYKELPAFDADAAVDMHRLAGDLEALGADLALIDTELPEVVLASQAAGLKTVLLNTWMSIWKHPGLPPLHRPILPGRGLSGSSMGLALAWRRHWTMRRLKHAARYLRHGRSYRVARLRTYAGEIGFPHASEFDFDHWLLPFSFRTLPILVLHALAFDFAHAPRDHVHYVGPMVNPNRTEPPLKSDDEAIINAVLERRRANKTRLVFGGFGSCFIADPDFLKRLFVAFVERPEWELVVPLGDKIADVDLSARPDNVHVVSWAPQLVLLEQADAAIVHGGINTIDECIHFETPMLAYSGGLTDMPGNVARLVHHGLGDEGDRKGDTPHRIAERLDRLMVDQQLRDRLKTQRAAAEIYMQERVLERTVERFLTGDLVGSAEPITSSRGALRQDARSRL